MNRLTLPHSKMQLPVIMYTHSFKTVFSQTQSKTFFKSKISNNQSVIVIRDTSPSKPGLLVKSFVS